MIKKYHTFLFPVLIVFFVLLSFSPTLFELSQSKKLFDARREFILEHNYYWPDFNLYLSKIRQGLDGKLLLQEKYTSEPHTGSVIQIFYGILGNIGRVAGMDANLSYQLGRMILSPILLFIILVFCFMLFSNYYMRVLSFLIVVTSGSFPRFYQDTAGNLHIGRFMEWWSNIDALQRMSFIPHILFGQVVSFFLLYLLVLRQKSFSTGRLIFCVILGNMLGIVFPPSLITLQGVILFLTMQGIYRNSLVLPFVVNTPQGKSFFAFTLRAVAGLSGTLPPVPPVVKLWYYFLFLLFTLPSLLYMSLLTKQLPWSWLVTYHRTHPMPIPFWEYFLGTGPIALIALLGAIVVIKEKKKQFFPFIIWTFVTIFFALLFSIIDIQSPLRFTQTGLFIPLGMLGGYFFFWLIRQGKQWKHIGIGILSLFLLHNLFMMKISLDWQTTFIRQRVNADVPLVPYPPQTMYPLKEWMDGIRWLKEHTNRDDVVLTDITAGNYIPAYAGNTVYWGQSNTVDYEWKEKKVQRFFGGLMSRQEAKEFLETNRIRYIFVGPQEKERMKKNLEDLYPFAKKVYTNETVLIYQSW